MMDLADQIAIGPHSKVDGPNGIAVGEYAEAIGEGAIAIGRGARAIGKGAIAVGDGVQAIGDGVVSIADGVMFDEERAKQLRKFVSDVFLGHNQGENAGSEYTLILDGDHDDGGPTNSSGFQ